MYGWIPLYIVRCGENTLNERNFYLNFYAEKYEEFRVYKFSFEEFIAMLSTGKSFWIFYVIYICGFNLTLF